MKHSRITISDIAEVMGALGGESYEELRATFDCVCSEIASKFGLYGPNNHPRKATIIDAIANSTCVSCSARKLSNTGLRQRVDGIYMECHKLAVGTLVEELQDKFSKMGFSVLILNEVETEYGRVDVLIKPTNFGVKLQYGINELTVEVKTGLSLSFSQIFRYLLDRENETIVLWRIRNRQVLLFRGTHLKPLLMRFMKTCILRGERLLADQTSTCDHPKQSDWSPTQEEIQAMLDDFAKALVETLPCVVKTVFETLEVKENGADARQAINE